MRIKAAAGSIHLVNARQSSAIMDEITALGLDIDQGMVVKLNNRIYFGAQAINMLTLLSSKNGLFNHLMFLAFRSKSAAVVLYPFLKMCRNLALWLLNIPQINNLKHTEAP